MKNSSVSTPAATVWLLKELETEMFAKGKPCYVTSTVDVLSAGRVKADGTSWRAIQYGLDCGVPMRKHQFAIAVGKRGNTLLIIPVCCRLQL